MEVINGKVWITNVDSSITDISQLDLHNDFWGDLTEAGAIFELGAGNPKEYGPGVYCTNFSIEQIIQIHSDSYKKKHEQNAEKANSNITINIQEAFSDEKEDIVEKIYSQIRRISRSYNLAYLHGMMGINTGDVLKNLENTYQNEIVPLIDSLSSEDKTRLVGKLEGLLNSDKDVNPKSIQNAIEYVKNSIGKGK